MLRTLVPSSLTNMTAAITTPIPVHRVVPFAHVADVQASLDFYSLLGFAAVSTQPDHAGALAWAWAQSVNPKTVLAPAAIMFARASGPINPAEQAVLFYMHCRNVGALRVHLLASGVRDGGAFASAQHSPPVCRMAFSITHPPYMQEGELRVHDPDGYVILIGQCE
jgi:hypothetical protein